MRQTKERLHQQLDETKQELVELKRTALNDMAFFRRMYNGSEQLSKKELGSANHRLMLANNEITQLKKELQSMIVRQTELEQSHAKQRQSVQVRHAAELKRAQQEKYARSRRYFTTVFSALAGHSPPN